MLEQKDLKVIIDDQEYPLLITLGFWKQCGFKREEAQIISEDPELYFNALKLAMFYGSKKAQKWNSLSDMSKDITDQMLEDLDEDYSERISFAMIHYLPEKLRKVILKKMNEADGNIEKAIDKSLNLEIDQEENDQKKN